MIFRKKKKKIKASVKTAQDLMNIIDIRDNIIISKDGHLITFLKVAPMNINLLTKKDIIQKQREITSNFKNIGDNIEFKFISIDRPIEIDALLSSYHDLIKTVENPIQKKLLRQEIYCLTDYSLSGQITEKLFYFMFWDKIGSDGGVRKLKEKVQNFADTIGIQTTIVTNRSEIIRLINLYNNPTYVQYDGEDFDTPTIPIIGDY